MRRNLFVALAAGALFAADPSGARAQNTPEQYAEQWTEARRGEGDWTQRATGQRTMVAGMLFDAGGGTAGGGGPAELLGQTQQSSATPPNPATAELLAAHNWERAQVGAPPLKWDPQLAANAAAYAAYLARIGRLVHAPREGRGIERENLSQGMIGWSPLQMLRNWTNEKRNFVPGIFPNVSRTGRWGDVSHYTQMIWPTTTSLGCGLATGRGAQWLVCRYSPGGNKDGKPVGLRPPHMPPERGR